MNDIEKCIYIDSMEEGGSQEINKRDLESIENINGSDNSNELKKRKRRRRAKK
jgi:hypothetical protein